MISGRDIPIEGLNKLQEPGNLQVLGKVVFEESAKSVLHLTVGDAGTS